MKTAPHFLKTQNPGVSPLENILKSFYRRKPNCIKSCKNLGCFCLEDCVPILFHSSRKKISNIEFWIWPDYQLCVKVECRCFRCAVSQRNVFSVHFSPGSYWGKYFTRIRQSAKKEDSVESRKLSWMWKSGWVFQRVLKRDPKGSSHQHTRVRAVTTERELIDFLICLDVLRRFN